MLFLKAIVAGIGFTLGAEVVLVSYQVIRNIRRQMKRK